MLEDVALVSHIRLECERCTGFRTNPSHNVVGPVFRQVCNDHFRSMSRKQQRGRFANSGGPTRNDGNLTEQPLCLHGVSHDLPNPVQRLMRAITSFDTPPSPEGIRNTMTIKRMP